MMHASFEIVFLNSLARFIRLEVNKIKFASHFHHIHAKNIKQEEQNEVQSSHNQPCGDCRFAQLCEIGPIDFLRSLHVDSTIQGDFGHVVRSSVGCLGSEIFWVMCGPFFRRKALF